MTDEQLHRFAEENAEDEIEETVGDINDEDIEEEEEEDDLWDSTDDVDFDDEPETD